MVVGYYNFAAGSFHTQKHFSRLYSIEVDFCSKKNEKVAFQPPFLALGVKYALQLLLVGKPVIEFIFVIINVFRHLLRLRRCERKSVKVAVFRRGWVILVNI